MVVPTVPIVIGAEVLRYGKVFCPSAVSVPLTPSSAPVSVGKFIPVPYTGPGLGS